MKKLALVIAVVIAVSAFGQKPDNIGSYDYYRFDIDVTTPCGVVAIDAKGSPYIRIEMKTMRTVKLLKVISKWPRSSDCEWMIWNSRTNSLNATGQQHSSFIVCNPAEGGTQGLACFETSVGGRGEGIPSATAKFAGELDYEWDEKENRFVAVSGHGTLAGFNNPSGCAAWSATAPATYNLSAKMFPAWGVWKMRRLGKLTKAEIKAILCND